MTAPANELWMSMPACPAVVGVVRDRARLALGRWGLGHLADDVLLCAAELTTNAVTATPGREIVFRLVREPAEVLLAVWDTSAAPPVQRPRAEPSLDALDLDPARFDDNGGHGLAIVAALAHRYGCEPASPRGKWVWARLRA